MNHRSRQKDLIREILSQSTDIADQMSFVPMRTDYSQDSSLSLTSVSFVPLSIATHLRKSIVSKLVAAEDCHFYFPDRSFHVTVKNIRSLADPPNFGPREIKIARQILADTVPKHRQVLFSFEDLILFPTSVSLIGYSDESFSTLVRDLDSRLSAAGLRDDKSYASDVIFFGSLTLCRLTRRPSERLKTAIQETVLRQPIEMTLTAVDLISCDSVCDPDKTERYGTYRLASPG